MTSLLTSYRHIVNPRLKHTYLSFDEKGTLLVKSPEVSTAYIEALLIKKSAWIRRTQGKIAAKKGRLDHIFQTHELYYLGNTHPIYLKKHEKKRTMIVQDDTGYTLYYHTFDTSLFMKQVDHFYKQEAHVVIPPLVDLWAKKMSLYPKEIKLRKTKRQWGSCSEKNILSFNTMLVKLPLDIIEYVIVHELAHIEHKHHQRSFWALVAQFMPNYKTRVAQLHTYTPH